MKSLLRPALRALALASVAGTVSLVGCDERTQARQDLEKATTTVRTVGLGAPSAQLASEGLAPAASALSNVSQTGTAGEQAAAALLQAQSALAAGEVSAHAAQQGEQKIRLALSRLSVYSSEWSHLNTLAASSASFDPSQQIASLVAQMNEKDQQIAAKRQELARTEQEIRDLRAQAEAHIDAAGALQRRATEASQQAARLSAREGVALVEQAASLRRQGDAKRLAGEQLLAQAEQIVPNIKEINTIIRQYENQKTKLDEARRGLLDRQAQSRRDAEESRGMAAQAQQLIQGELRDIRSTMESEYTPMFDKAAGDFARAASTARRAGASNAAAKLLAGSAQSSLAGLHFNKARLLNSMTGVLDVLAKLEPRLDGHAQIVAMQADSHAKEQEAIAAARSALEDARSSFSGVPVRGEEKQKLERLNEMMERFLDGGSVADLAPTQVSDATSAPAVSNPTNTTGEGDAIPAGAKQLVESTIASMKAGRWDEVKASYIINTEAGRQLLDSSFRAVSEGTRLDRAFRARFNTSFADALRGVPGGEMMGGMMSQLSRGDMSNVDPATVTYTRNDAGVQVVMGGVGMPLQAVERDGAWKFDGAQLDAMAPAMAGQLQGLKAMIDAQSSLARRVEAGEFPDANSAAAAFMQAVGAAMMGGGGG